MAQLGHRIGGHHFCWVIQGQQQAADKRTLLAGEAQNRDCGSLAQVTTVPKQGATDGYRCWLGCYNTTWPCCWAVS